MTAFCAEAAGPQSWAVQAALCEREAYYASDPAVQAQALERKAQILSSEGREPAALEALGRIPLYRLGPEDAARIQAFQESLCAAGDPEALNSSEPPVLKITSDLALAGLGVFQAFSGQWVSAYLTFTYGLYNIWGLVF